MPYACPPHLRHLRHLRRVWLVLSLVLLASPAQATSVVAKPFSAVVQAAEVIAVGTVTAIAAEWDAAHQPAVYPRHLLHAGRAERRTHRARADPPAARWPAS